jgi:hypothetical protein
MCIRLPLAWFILFEEHVLARLNLYKKSLSWFNLFRGHYSSLGVRGSVVG